MSSSAELKVLRDGLARLRSDLLGVKVQLKLRKWIVSVKDGFDPDQPRDELGMWSDGGTQTASSASRETECEAQYARDTFICNSLQLRSCWERAAERYAACLRGRAIPVLRF